MKRIFGDMLNNNFPINDIFATKYCSYDYWNYSLIQTGY